MPPRERLEADPIKTFAAKGELARESRERRRNGTGAVDLSIDDSGPVFFVNKVGNVGIRIRIHENLGRLGVTTSRGNGDSAGSQEGLKLSTE
jgi:nucleoid-associated protein YgaU